jgi:hypothetical protein
MKITISYFWLTLHALTLCVNLKAQTINWMSLTEENKCIVNANTGIEYGMIYGIGLGYSLKAKLPTVLQISYSLPSGKKITDDFKTKIGGKIRVFKMKHFLICADVHGIFRRYENEFVRLINFGSDVAAVAGYYKSSWFVAGEIGFDKAIYTNFRHSQVYKSNFQQVLDGWYKPATGGNFYYGVQTGISFKQHDFSMRMGLLLTQDFKTTPSAPFYGLLGYNYRLGNTKK